MQSERPDDDYSHGGEPWMESEEMCPDCTLMLWQRSWWDDPPENGGACIGTEYKCGLCQYQELR